MIELEMVSSARSIVPQKLEGADAVVIDVLRATSVMVTAFHNGLKALFTVTSPEDAFHMREEHPEYLLGGEKDAVWVPGFDLDNSPFDYTPEKVSGKTLVMSTSNGTRAIHGARKASRLVIGSFLNAAAITRYFSGSQRVVLVCSGSNNSFTLEDSLCAGYITELFARQEEQVKMSDEVIAMHALYMAHQNRLYDFASCGNHFQLLERKGFKKDLEYCFTRDVITCVPFLSGNCFFI